MMNILFNINVYDLLRADNYVVFIFAVRKNYYHGKKNRWKNILDFFIDKLIDYMKNSENSKDIISIKVFSYILLNYKDISKEGRILDKIWRKNSDKGIAEILLQVEKLESRRSGVKIDRKIDRLKRIDKKLKESFLEYKTNLSNNINEVLPTKIPLEVMSKDVLKYLVE